MSVLEALAALFYAYCFIFLVDFVQWTQQQFNQLKVIWQAHGALDLFWLCVLVVGIFALRYVHRVLQQITPRPVPKPAPWLAPLVLLCLLYYLYEAFALWNTWRLLAQPDAQEWLLPARAYWPGFIQLPLVIIGVLLLYRRNLNALLFLGTAAFVFIADVLQAVVSGLIPTNYLIGALLFGGLKFGVPLAAAWVVLLPGKTPDTPHQQN